jgi:hypothetical protein
MSAEIWESYDEDYGKAEPLNTSLVPDGEYEAIVTHCAPGESKKKGTPQIQWGFTIDGGAQDGRKLFKDQNITPQGMAFVRADFEAVGMPKEWKFSECMAALPKVIGMKLKVKQHTKKGEQYPTLYINGRVDSQPVATPAPAPAVQPALPGVPAASTPFD